MKTRVITKTMLLIFLTTFFAAPALYAETPYAPRVQVHGYSEKAVDPDSVIVKVRLENKAGSPRMAEDLHRKTRGDTLKALADLGLSESGMKVSGPYMGPESSVASGLPITSQDLDGVSRLLQAVSGKPGMTVESITYGHTQQAALVE